MTSIYEDGDFADLVVQKYGEVAGSHLTVEFVFDEWIWRVWDHSTEEGKDHIADFYVEDLAYWFVQAHANQPRVNDLIRKSMDAAERSEERYDELVRTIVHGGGE